MAFLGTLALLASYAATSGCASLASSATGDFVERLSASILDNDDPQLVGDSLPTFLVLMDSVARSPDAGAESLGAAARLYAAYALYFVDDPERAATLAGRARGYGERALCAAEAAGCDIGGQPFAEYRGRLDRFGPSSADALLSHVIGSLAYIRTHSDDWQALADLPKMEASLERLLVIGGAEDAASINTYLGILNTLRPPALGGQPERGRAFFKKALQASSGRDLTIPVEYARGYARLVYDRELHDRLLKEVIDADPHAPGLTLFNVIAQRQAAVLLEDADSYF